MSRDVDPEALADGMRLMVGIVSEIGRTAVSLADSLESITRSIASGLTRDEARYVFGARNYQLISTNSGSQVLIPLSRRR